MDKTGPGLCARFHPVLTQQGEEYLTCDCDTEGSADLLERLHGTRTGPCVLRFNARHCDLKQRHDRRSHAKAADDQRHGEQMRVLVSPNAVDHDPKSNHADSQQCSTACNSESQILVSKPYGECGRKHNADRERRGHKAALQGRQAKPRLQEDGENKEQTGDAGEEQRHQPKADQLGPVFQKSFGHQRGQPALAQATFPKHKADHHWHTG